MFGIDLWDASLAPALLVAGIAGVLSFLSPCVLPIVPPYLAFMAGASMEDLREGTSADREVTKAAAFFVLGLSTVFLLLGLAVVLADYGADPGRAEAIRERLTGVALSGGGLDGIAAALTAALAREVTIVDQEGVLIAGRRSEDPDDGGADPGEPARTWSFPITVGGAVRGHVLVAGEGEPTLGQRRLIRQSCFAAAMHIAQALASMELDRKLRTHFLEEIVSGYHSDGPTIRQRSRLFGWDLNGVALPDGAT